MDQSWYTLSYLSYVFSVILGIVIGTILCVFPRHQKSSNFLLGLAMFFLSWDLFIIFALESKIILEIPHIFRTGNVAALLLLPCSYLYVRNTLKPQPFLYRDLIHLIPVLLYIIDFAPFFTLSGAEKGALLTNYLASPTPISQFPEGWLFPTKFQGAARFCLAAFYWILQLWLLFKFRKSGPMVASKGDQDTRNWLTTFVIIQFFLFSPYLIGVTINAGLVMHLFVQLFARFTVIFIAFVLLFKPQILYGINPLENGNEVLGNGLNGHPVPGSERENRLVEKILMDDLNEQVSMVNGANREQAQQINDMIRELMETKSVYLQHRYSIHDLASALHMPTHQLSAVLNKELKMSFNDCLNKFRIKYCLQRIKDGALARLKLEALGYECGFNNRNSFTTAFKKWTGQTPSQYLKDPNNMDESTKRRTAFELNDDQ